MKKSCPTVVQTFLPWSVSMVTMTMSLLTLSKIPKLEWLRKFDCVNDQGPMWFYVNGPCMSVSTPPHSCHRRSSGSTAVVCRSGRLNTTSSWPGSLWSPPSCRGGHGNRPLCPRPPRLQRWEQKTDNHIPMHNPKTGHNGHKASEYTVHSPLYLSHILLCCSLMLKMFKYFFPLINLYIQYPIITKRKLNFRNLSTRNNWNIMT